MEIFLNILVEYLAEAVAVFIITVLGIYGTKLINKLKQKQGLENISIATE